MKINNPIHKTPSYIKAQYYKYVSLYCQDASKMLAIEIDKYIIEQLIETANNGK